MGVYMISIPYALNDPRLLFEKSAGGGGGNPGTSDLLSQQEMVIHYYTTPELWKNIYAEHKVPNYLAKHTIKN